MHPLPYHSLDVAAVFDALFDLYRPAWVPAWLKPYLLFLVALHDVGKITRSFQYQCVDTLPQVWPRNVLGEAVKPPRTARHDTLGFHILDRRFSGALRGVFKGWDYNHSVRPLLRASTGHHGRPPRELDGPKFLPPNEYCADCHAVAGEFISDLRDLFLRDAAPLPEVAPEAFAARLSWWFAGLVNLADWIGSNPGWFKYRRPVFDLETYWRGARGLAARAVREAGVVPGRLAPLAAFEDLFRGAGIEAPSPVQRWCSTVPLPEGPKLVFVEDETGNGKTEAAIMLAHRMNAMGDGVGFYFALPTQATANQMYDRCGGDDDQHGDGGYLRRLFDEGERPSLILAHGKRALNKKFRNSILDPVAAAAASGEGPDRDDLSDDWAEDDEDRPGAECAAWIASDARTAFLADVGVGTIDQALLAAMPSKFGALRMLGLSRRVLVIDEAHAYDSYMIAIIKALLGLHARMGGSAVVLSATLPIAMRRELAAAFAEGLGLPEPPTLEARGYPLATLVSRSGVGEEHEALASDGPSPRRGRDEAIVEIVEDVGAVLDRIEKAAKEGGAVGWVRNTVADAMAACDLLRARGLDVTLFHARYVMGDRADIEGKVLGMLGKKAPGKNRRGKVIVATQVIEQSLDIDFDLLVSDPAPVDLLIQRAGRLWRHRLRTDEGRPVEKARMLVAGPLPVDDPPVRWIAGHGDGVLSVRGSMFVYRDTALLWRSLRIVAGEGRIGGDPASFRRMVEAAYDPDAWAAAGYGGPFVPETLSETAQKALRDENRKEHLGNQAALGGGKGYGGEGWPHEAQVRTRLSDLPSVTLRLARVEEGRAGRRRLAPIYATDEGGLRHWALSEVTVRHAALAEPRFDDPDLGRLVERAKATWPRLDRRTPLVAMDKDGDGWSAEVTGKDGRRYAVRYDHARGCEIAVLKAAAAG